MATDGNLSGLFVGSDHSVVYSDSSSSPPDMSAWTVVLDIRYTDLDDTALVSKTGVVSGVYDADPDVNAQVVTFTLTDDDLDAGVIVGDDPKLRYSIKRTDAGSEQPLRYGNCTITRITQV